MTWVRITDTSSVNLRFLIDQGLMLITAELHELFSPVLIALGGDDWTIELRPVVSRDRHGSEGSLARLDIGSYARMLRVDWHGRTRLREKLGLDDYAKKHVQLERVRQVRNAFAHPDQAADVADARSSLGIMVTFAEVAALDAHQPLSEMLAEVNALVSGVPVKGPTDERVQELRALANRQAQQISEAEEGRAKAEAAVEDAVTRANSAEATRHQVEEEAAQLRKEIAAQGAKVRDASSASAEQHRLLLDDLRARERAADQRLLDVEDAAQRAQAEADRAQATQAQASKRASQLERENDQLRTQLAETQAAATVVGSPDEIRRLLSDIQDTVTSTLAQNTASVTEPDAELPEPGGRWPYRRGDEVWTIGVDGEMYRRSDGMSLAALVGDELAGRLVDQFLAVRPSGGRVWVDEDRDASTYLDGQLVYLGRLTEDSATTEGGIALGTPLGDFKGRRYQISPGRIVERTGNTSLAPALGSDAVRALAKRLLEVRPKGGVFRVNGEGIVATYLDGGWVYAGTVRRSEWFPGHLR